MENLEMREIESAIEAILFASGEPVHIDRICVAMDMDRATAELVLRRRRCTCCCRCAPFCPRRWKWL